MNDRTEFKFSRVPSIFKRLAWLSLLTLVFVLFQATPKASVAAKHELPKQPSANVQVSNAPLAGSSVYLPFIRGGTPQVLPMLIGVYSPAYMGEQANIDAYLKGLDSWAGLSRSANKGHSIAGDFLDIEDAYAWYNVPVPAELLWTNGYTKFINLMTSRSAAAIARGDIDNAIRSWAQAYEGWVDDGGNRKAFLAPLPEMNGSWTAYGCDPTNFKAAYNRIQSIFESEGVTRDKVWWVFAPNGWSSPCAAMSAYYPGDANVDVIGFSSYNQSYATAWMTPTEVFDPYLEIIRTQVSSNKPVFVAQTGSCSTKGDKDQWLRDAYSYLLNKGIRGVIYFNMDQSWECDWAVYQPTGRKLQGYKDAVTAPNATRYIAPATLAGTVLPP